MLTLDAALTGATGQGLVAGLAFVTFMLLLFVLRRYAAGLRPETTRKLLHVGSGVLTVTFPFVFADIWPVLALTAAAGGVLAAVRWVPALRARAAVVVHRVERPTYGELYFPLAIAILFWRTHGQHPLLFVIPVLILTFADTAAAVVGTAFGGRRHGGGTEKTLAGSVAFAVVAFASAQAAFLAWPAIDRVAALVASLTLAILVTLVERAARRGLDNLLIPFTSYVLLRGMLLGLA
jgi:phytol kinase